MKKYLIAILIVLFAASAQAGVLVNLPYTGSLADSNGNLTSGTVDRDSDIITVKKGSAVTARGSGENLALWSEDLSNAAWTKVRSSISGTDGIVANTDNNTHYIYDSTTATLTDGATYTLSLKIKPGAQTWAQVRFRDANTIYHSAYFDIGNGVVGNTENLVSSGISSIDENGYYRCYLTFIIDGVTTKVHYIYAASANGNRTFTGDGSTVSIYVKEVQLEEIDTSAQYTYEPWVYAKTEGSTAIIPAEQPYTDNGGFNGGPHENKCLYSRDWTDATWTKSNVTAVLDVTGIDGSANSATRLTASSVNGTVKQTITVPDTDNTVAVWAKRITGSGSVYITDDDFTSETEITLTTDWQLFQINDAGTDPTFGVKIATSGDVIAVDFAHAGVEPFYPQTLIPTTTVPVSIAAQTTSWTMSDDLKNVLSDAVGDATSEGTLALEWTPWFVSSDVSANIGILSVSNTPVSLMFINANNRILSFDGTSYTYIHNASWSSGVTYRLFVRWSKANNEFQISIKPVGGTLSHATAAAYDGSFTLGADLIIGYGNDYPFSVKKLMIYDEWKSDTFLDSWTGGLGGGNNNLLLLGVQ